MDHTPTAPPPTLTPSSESEVLGKFIILHVIQVHALYACSYIYMHVKEERSFLLVWQHMQMSIIIVLFTPCSYCKGGGDGNSAE